MSKNKTILKRERRKRRVRGKISQVSDRLRLTVFRSNKYIYAQVIDSKTNHTIASENDLKDRSGKATKSKRAYIVGERLGKKLSKLKVKMVVYDRGPYKYIGRVKSLAEGVMSAKIKI